MRITIAVLSFLLGASALAQKDPSPALACNLKAIGAEERPRYAALVKRLRAAVRERSELPDGYLYRLEGKAVTLPEVAEWIALERLCCPFLSLRLEADGQKSDWVLTLQGPVGVKAILDGEFPADR